MEKYQTMEKLKGMIPFPCCPQEKVMAYESSSGRVSSRCPRCKKFAIFDYDSMTSQLAPPMRGAVHRAKLNNGAYRLS